MNIPNPENLPSQKFPLDGSDANLSSFHKGLLDQLLELAEELVDAGAKIHILVKPIDGFPGAPDSMGDSVYSESEKLRGLFLENWGGVTISLEYAGSDEEWFKAQVPEMQDRINSIVLGS